ncbi:hypothetical protein [Leptospira alstonii]|uniref:hypothetical protein n=1 Tax=Leptospira alstonii TaxID=28452 RepID=UPI00056010A2|nr:hypothetical protein [Leptospira alstonii]
MEYYFCRQNLFEETETLEISGHTRATGQLFWTAGLKFAKPLSTEVLELNSEYGTEFPAFFDTTVPVMSTELIQAFYDAGVDNFDAYTVVLKRTDTGEKFHNYKAVNFIGCVDALDRTKTRIGKDAFQRYYSVAIDRDRALDLKCFRLKEGPSLLVVRQDVAECLQMRNFKALMLQRTEDYDGV